MNGSCKFHRPNQCEARYYHENEHFWSGAENALTNFGCSYGAQELDAQTWSHHTKSMEEVVHHHQNQCDTNYCPKIEHFGNGMVYNLTEVGCSYGALWKDAQTCNHRSKWKVQKPDCQGHTNHYQVDKSWHEMNH